MSRVNYAKSGIDASSSESSFSETYVFSHTCHSLTSYHPPAHTIFRTHCFLDKTALQSAVDDYISQDCTNDPLCGPGQEYGWSIGTWCVLRYGYARIVCRHNYRSSFIQRRSIGVGHIAVTQAAWCSAWVFLQSESKEQCPTTKLPALSSPAWSVLWRERHFVTFHLILTNLPPFPLKQITGVLGSSLADDALANSKAQALSFSQLTIRKARYHLGRLVIILDTKSPRGASRQGKHHLGCSHFAHSHSGVLAGLAS